MKRFIIILITVLISQFATTVVAQDFQDLKMKLTHGTTFVGGLHFQTWGIEGDQRVTEWVIPAVYLIPINRRLNFDIWTAPTFASFSSVDGGLNGLSDTRIRGSYLMMQESLLLTAGINLPTGKSSLGAEESAVASILSINAMDFRVPNLGQGFKINLGGAYAQELNGTMVGGGIGLLLQGAFKPVKGSDFKYTPGNEITLTLGADRSVEFGGREFKLTGDIAYTLYGNDELDGQEVFKSGNKLLIDLRSAFNIEPIDVMVYLRNRSKGKNQSGIGNIIEESNNSNGNQFELGGMGFYPFDERITLKGLLDIKMHSRNANETAGAFIFGIGGGAEYTWSEKMVFDGLIKFSKGSLKVPDDSVGLTGFEIGVGIRYKL